MRYIFLLLFRLVQFSTVAQEARVEKFTGVQVGFLGAWVHREIPLTNTIALRAEVGMDGAYWGGILWPRAGYLYTPVMTAEPRIYYNLDKRASKSKRIANNSAGFFFHQNKLTSKRFPYFELSQYRNLS